MNGKTHQVGGLCFGLVATSCLFSTPTDTSTLLIGGSLIAGSVVGSLFPDIDHPNSKMGQKLGPISKWISKGFGHRGFIHSPFFAMVLMLLLLLSYPFLIPILPYLYWIGTFLVVWVLRKWLLPKRIGIFQWAFLLLIWVGIGFIYPQTQAYLQPIYYGASLGFFVGYISHLILDALTLQGIPALAPLSKKKYRLMKLTTGKHEGITIFILGMMTTVIVCVQWF